MPPLSMLIKPASGACNLHCAYCFYHALTDSRQVKNYGFMSPETLEILVKKALAFADGTCTFAFQGGEPTLAGLPFYEKLIQYQQKYNTKGVKISNAIQTNGIGMDSPWAEFFAKHQFLVGLSLDGTKDLHDQNRRFPDARGSFQGVMNAARLFDQAGVSYNILSVVTKNMARHGQKVYAFYKKNGFGYLQFIPCLDSLDEERGSNPYSLPPQGYAQFLKTMFDLWHRDFKRGERVSIRYFDNILGMIMGQPPEACGMSGVCNCQFVVEADGSVYPCDFYVTDQWRIGSIEDCRFDEMRSSEICRRFIAESRQLHPDCRACGWFALCRGGCKRDREPNAEGGKSYYCESYRSFFAHALPGFRELALLLRAGG